jgi:hypothetical protein
MAKWFDLTGELANRINTIYCSKLPIIAEKIASF